VCRSRPAGPARASRRSPLCVGRAALIGMSLTASFSPRGAALHLPASAHAQRPYPRTQPPQRPNPHSRALNTRGAASRGFLPRGLCDTCPQVGAARRSVPFAGQVSHNPKQDLVATNGRFGGVEPERIRPERRTALEKPDGRVWVETGCSKLLICRSRADACFRRLPAQTVTRGVKRPRHPCEANPDGLPKPASSSAAQASARRGCRLLSLHCVRHERVVSR